MTNAPFPSRPPWASYVNFGRISSRGAEFVQPPGAPRSLPSAKTVAVVARVVTIKNNRHADCTRMVTNLRCVWQVMGSLLLAHTSRGQLWGRVPMTDDGVKPLHIIESSVSQVDGCSTIGDEPMLEHNERSRLPQPITMNPDARSSMWSERLSGSEVVTNEPRVECGQSKPRAAVKWEGESFGRERSGSIAGSIEAFDSRAWSRGDV